MLGRHAKGFRIYIPKSVELSKDTWVHVKIETYKGDLAKVMDVDNVRQRVTIKLVLRKDLQVMANKLEGKDVGKNKAFVPPPRFINIPEVKDMRIPVEHKRDLVIGELFETIEGMMFKDGYVYKTVSMKSISSQNIQPSFDKLLKFQRRGDDASDDVADLSSLLANRKKGCFMKGDAVVVIRGDLKNLMGWVEKVEDDNVLVKPKMKGPTSSTTSFTLNDNKGPKNSILYEDDESYMQRGAQGRNQYDKAEEGDKLFLVPDQWQSFPGSRLIDSPLENRDSKGSIEAVESNMEVPEVFQDNARNAIVSFREFATSGNENGLNVSGGSVKSGGNNFGTFYGKGSTSSPIVSTSNRIG